MVSAWRKSARSGANGNCVEVATDSPRLTEAWPRSTTAAAGSTAPTADVLVRNSREPDGAVLRLHADEMAAFLAAIKAGEFDDLLPSGADHADRTSDMGAGDRLAGSPDGDPSPFATEIDRRDAEVSPR